MHSPSRLRRAAIAAAGAVVLLVGAAGATSALAGDQPNPNSGAQGPDPAAISALLPAGSELRFVSVAPCRIIDTRKSGGALVAGQRTFDATMANYSTQGGFAGSCNIIDSAVSVQLNIGAISQNNKTSDIRGWATGAPEPTASLVNYNPSGPVANMVTVPLNTSGQFNLKTPGAAHIFADVAGFWVKPLYATVYTDGTVYSGLSSGLVSSTRDSLGQYTVTFDRDVELCGATTSDWTFATAREISADVRYAASPNAVTIVTRNASTNALEDALFTVSLTC
jgi:hypothetical protein